MSNVWLSTDLHALHAGPLLLGRGPAGAQTVRLPVLPSGTFQHPTYGALEWTGAKFSQIKRNFDAKVTGFQPMLSFDHATMNPFAPTAPAAGWLTELQIETAGLFAQAELTPIGAQAIADRTYRYISAEYAAEWTNSLGKKFEHVLIGATLTNTPFHDTMPALFSTPAAPKGTTTMTTTKQKPEETFTQLVQRLQRENGGDLTEAYLEAGRMHPEATRRYRGVGSGIGHRSELEQLIVSTMARTGCTLEQATLAAKLVLGL